MSEVETNPIEDLVQSALDQNYTAASDIFNNLMGEKMAAALDQQKIGIADQIFNGAEPEEADFDDNEELEDDEDVEVTDEEIDDAVEDEDDDED